MAILQLKYLVYARIPNIYMMLLESKGFGLMVAKQIAFHQDIDTSY